METAKAQLSQWALNVSPSPTLAVDAKAKAMKAAGEDIYSLAAGEPDFDTPEFIKQACIKAIQEGKTKYVPSSGILPLREAIAQKYEKDYGMTGLGPMNTVVSPGGKLSCYLSILASCGPGDEVIIPAPYWVSYPEMVKLAGAKPVFVQADDTTDFKITPDQLEEAITKRSRMLILNSPSNPTGSVYSKTELEAIGDIVLKHGLMVLSDEIYEHLLYDGVEFTCFAAISKELEAVTFTASGFSKTYSMTGWRLGTLVAPEPLAKAVGTLQTQMTSNATSFAQYGALEALKNESARKAALGEMLQVFDERRVRLFEGLNAIEGISSQRAQGAFYLFPNISSFRLGSTDFASRLLEEMKVATVPGIAFGAEGYIRVGYATSDEVIDGALERLEQFCQKLRS